MMSAEFRADINRPVETLPWRDECAQCAELRRDVIDNGGLGLATLTVAVCRHFERVHGLTLVQA